MLLFKVFIMKKTIDIEVCAYSLESCLAAREAGASRVELCASPFEGGTTPSAASIYGAIEILKKPYSNCAEEKPLELYVMIRPRGGDFLYSNLEFAQMEQEIEFIKSCCLNERESNKTVDGVVFGILNVDGTIDIERTKLLVERAKNGVWVDPVSGSKKLCKKLAVTFHRAIDMSCGFDQFKNKEQKFSVLEDVIATGADRVLSSGFYANALEGKQAIRAMVKQAAGRIEIMAGGGVSADNALELAKLGVDAIHMSGKNTRESKMVYQNEVLSMGNAKGIPEYSIIYTCKDKVAKVKSLFNSLIITALCLLTLSCSGVKGEHFITNAEYLAMVEKDFNKRDSLLGGEFSRAFDSLDFSLAEREAMEFLYAYSPLEDVTSYNPNFWIENVRQTFKVKSVMPWGSKIPEALFRHYVLPLRANNEEIDSARLLFYKELEPLVKDSKTMEEAALAVNHWCHQKANYQPTNARTCSPTAMITRTYGRCGEESVFAVSALRAVGLPARQIYTPRWAHCDDNHAWIEVWVDGQWKFLGACEPEPALNMAWFTFPASRGLFMQTKVFGKYDGDEEVVKRDHLLTYINATSTYTDTNKPKVKVVDKDGKAIEGAVVDYKVYNYSEYYTVASLTTDINGETSLTMGQGDWVIWASANGKYNYVKINPKGLDEIKIVLDDSKISIAQTLTITPPEGKQIFLSVNEKEREINDKLFAQEDSIRLAKIASFINETESNNFAQKIGVNSKELWPLLKVSMGNYTEIQKFLNLTSNFSKESFKDKESANMFMNASLTLLKVIEEKDLQDIKAEILFSHLIACKDLLSNSSKTFNDSAMQFIVKYIVSPRISTEAIKPWRNCLKTFLAELESSKNISLDNIAENAEQTNKLVEQLLVKIQDIKIDSSTGRGDVIITPCNVAKFKHCEQISKNVFFVAACRTLGIPARLNPVDSKPQYFIGNLSKGTWENAIFNKDNNLPDTKSSNGNAKGKLMLKINEGNPLYYINFTVSKIEDGRTILMELGSAAEGDMGSGMTFKSIFKNDVELEAGDYIVITGNRNSDGSVVSNMVPFKIEEGKTTSLNIEIPKIETNFKAIANIKGLNKLLKLPTKGYTAISIMAANNEPSNHMIRDISAMSGEFEKYNIEFSFMFRNLAEKDKFIKTNTKTLPKNLLLKVDEQASVENLIKAAIPAANGAELPLLLMVNAAGDVVYFSHGYQIGLGYQISKYLSK